MQALARDVVADHGHVDALFHLVGGWRGGDRFTDSTDDDWRWLSGNLVDTLRHTTLALHDHLLASGRGRVAIVSAAAAQAPTAGNAAYASAKAAAETWLGALADSFGSESATPGSAAVVGVVRWIGTGRTATSPAEDRRVAHRAARRRSLSPQRRARRPVGGRAPRLPDPSDPATVIARPQ